MALLKSSNMTIRVVRPNLFSPVKQSVKDKFFWIIIPSLSFARVETFNTHSNISSRTWSWSDIAWPQVQNVVLLAFYICCSSRSEKADWHQNHPFVRIYIQHAVLNVRREQFYLQCRINLRKKVQPQSTTKLLTRYHSKCKILLWQTNFIPSTLTFTPTLTLPSPTHRPHAQCFSVYYDS